MIFDVETRPLEEVDGLQPPRAGVFGHDHSINDGLLCSRRVVGQHSTLLETPTRDASIGRYGYDDVRRLAGCSLNFPDSGASRGTAPEGARWDHGAGSALR